VWHHGHRIFVPASRRFTSSGVVQLEQANRIVLRDWLKIIS
jgi:hypothetical protein